MTEQPRTDYTFKENGRAIVRYTYSDRVVVYVAGSHDRVFRGPLRRVRSFLYVHHKDTV